MTSVESFLVNEMEEVVEDPTKATEWKEAVEKLNLDGQMQLCNVSLDSPIPFPLMNVGQEKMWEVLCARKSLLKDYKASAIPLQALAIIGLCVQKEWFGKIEIWYDDVDPDPIAVGCDGESKYLLCRWGDELANMTKLAEKARERWICKQTAHWQERIEHYQKMLRIPDYAANKFFSEKWYYDG